MLKNFIPLDSDSLFTIELNWFIWLETWVLLYADPNGVAPQSGIDNTKSLSLLPFNNEIDLSIILIKSSLNSCWLLPWNWLLTPIKIDINP